MFKLTRIPALAVLFALGLLMLSQGPARAISVTASQDPIQVNKPVTFSIQAAAQQLNCTVEIAYGDGGGFEPVGTVDINGATLTATHVYDSPGSYTVRVRSATGCALTSPDPVSIQVEAISFQINRIELYFENNRPEITLQRNQRPPKLYAKIQFSGSGYLRGYWEVDGFRRYLVSRHLRVGPTEVFTYPQVPPLPTFEPGTHRVRFVITRPRMDIEFPTALYYVTAEEAVRKAEIALVRPEDQGTVAYAPVDFRWKEEPRAAVYLLELYSKGSGTRVYSAYSKDGSYRLKPEALQRHFTPGHAYRWQVIGFNERNQPVAQSTRATFSFAQEQAYLPGQILLVTEPTEQARRTLRQARQEYQFQLVDTFVVKTLGVQVSVFSTEEDIFSVIADLQGQAGVVLAQPNHVFQTFTEPLSDIQDVKDLLGIESLQTDLCGRGVTVGIVDTGVDLEHRDLSGAVAFSANCLPDSQYQAEIHGTAMAGLIGARRNGYGMSGLAPCCHILALRACRQMEESLAQGECYTSAIVRALDLGLDKGAEIINLCLGAGTSDELVSRLLYKGAQKGVLFVAPVGNRSDLRKISFPASHPGVLAVGGITEKGAMYPNDALCSKADLCAPCDHLLTTLPEGKHNFLSGTSLSSSVITGLLALSSERRSLSLHDLPDFNGDMRQWTKSLLEPNRSARE